VPALTVPESNRSGPLVYNVALWAQYNRAEEALWWYGGWDLVKLCKEYHGAANLPLQSLDSCTMCPFSNSAVLEAQWHELEALFTGSPHSPLSYRALYPPRRLSASIPLARSTLVATRAVVNLPLQSLDSCTMCPFSNSAVLEAQWHELEALFMQRSNYLGVREEGFEFMPLRL
jgi:hypothetical protein